MIDRASLTTLLLRERTFADKTPAVQQLIVEMLMILQLLGVPLESAPVRQRRNERMAMTVLAVADVSTSSDWPNAKDITQGRSMKSRDIIACINDHFGESISPGSYDDIRRKDLLRPVQAGIVVPTRPDASRNDSTRGYALAEDAARVIRRFGQPTWEAEVAAYMSDRIPLSDQLSGARQLDVVPIELPTGVTHYLTRGEHNDLQKAVIEEFLPRFGHGAELLYIGDTANKFVFVDRERLTELRFFELAHGELPDVIAYAPAHNWLFLIEAVHSSGPISPERLLNLKSLTSQCVAGVIYVTAFLNRATFRKWVTEIAWETEVWIAESPDHLIHFNGGKFLGPHVTPV